MKQLTCEMCGSTDMVKQEGVFVCQTCGTKYTVEEAKKMMVEGTVEVTGTVKVDNTNRTENMIINARRAFSNHNYSQAEELCRNILIEDSNNAMAILYEGLSIGWQGNTSNNKLIQAVNSANRALTICHKQETMPINFEIFAIEAGQSIISLLMAMLSAYSNNIAAESRKYVLKTESIGRRAKLSSANLNALRQEAATEEENYQKKRKEILNFMNNDSLRVLSVFTTILNLMDNVSLYQEATFVTLKNLLVSFTSEASKEILFYENKNKFEAVIDAYKKQSQEITKIQKTKALEKYWAEHSEEKQQLESELNKLQEELNVLKPQLIPFEKEISDLKNDREKEAPSEKEKDTVLSEISRLRKEQEQLGLFKGKEKKAIQSQINELNARLLTINEAIELEKKEQLQDCNAKIREVEEKAKPIKDKVTATQKRIEEINTELTKER